VAGSSFPGHCLNMTGGLLPGWAAHVTVRGSERQHDRLADDLLLLGSSRGQPHALRFRQSRPNLAGRYTASGDRLPAMRGWLCSAAFRGPGSHCSAGVAALLAGASDFPVTGPHASLLEPRRR
jgi:hypothetical protein